mmetsp:Transcript_18904/g.46907  ORF Transcript_18904/g.46907 Transcript_18904/m.46907 type:complete len:254 (+) Transcript_18904:159-920(+)
MPEMLEADVTRMNKSSLLKGSIPILLAIIALILGTAPSFQCETLQFSQVENDVGHLLLVGPYSYRTKYAKEWSDETFAAQTCRNYDKNGLEFKFEKDSKTQTVWAFSIMTPIIGALIICKSFMDLTCGGVSGYGGKSNYSCVGYSYFFTAIFQGIVLIIDQSSLCFDNPALQYLEANNPNLASTLSDECEVTTGYILQAIAVALWILAGAVTLYFKDITLIYEQPQQAQEATYAQNADGTAQETKVVAEQPKA